VTAAIVFDDKTTAPTRPLREFLAPLERHDDGRRELARRSKAYRFRARTLHGLDRGSGIVKFYRGDLKTVLSERAAQAITGRILRPDDRARARETQRKAGKLKARALVGNGEYLIDIAFDVPKTVDVLSYLIAQTRVVVKASGAVRFLGSVIPKAARHKFSQLFRGKLVRRKSFAAEVKLYVRMGRALRAGIFLAPARGAAGYGNVGSL
jgi:hypothetical protein